jgi:hypothetical protein
MTQAEAAKRNGRDEDHLVYEEFNISQYEDGSVLDCATMETYTAKEIVAGAKVMPVCFSSRDPKYVKALNADLLRNALKYTKGGH